MLRNIFNRQAFDNTTVLTPSDFSSGKPVKTRDFKVLLSHHKESSHCLRFGKQLSQSGMPIYNHVIYFELANSGLYGKKP